MPSRRRAAVAVALTQTNCWRELAVTAIHLAPVGSPITIQLARHALPIIEAVTAVWCVGCCCTWGAAVLAGLPVLSSAAVGGRVGTGDGDGELVGDGVSVALN